ncbi:dynein intermediate chain 2, ciliary-like [Homarus americanus]|uniref:dynein intermediate chain 2, ciliary-like n=1 Tax=Homarus americanus TaxID=6706 RepID=UPI001C43EF67|nr:dynein intermediate chain 2, ciliary-like [Homarus americanus]
MATCIDFRPDNESVVLLGVDTGAVFQCSTICLRHSLYRYAAHSSPVRGVTWNTYHNGIFLSCSLDWTVKVWLQHSPSPLITLDLGGPVAGVSWSPYSSSVLVAVTDECRVFVYDLYLRRCSPMCVQNLAQRRRLAASCVAFSPFYPAIIIGGERSHLVSLKLSPNLRSVHKDASELQGEAGSAGKEAAEHFKPMLLEMIKDKGYVPEQVFNADETGPFYECMGNRTYITKAHKVAPGLRTFKYRLTLLFCGNTAGYFKCKPMLVVFGSPIKRPV